MEYRLIKHTVWFCRDIILVMFSLIFSVVLLTKPHGNNVLLVVYPQLELNLRSLLTLLSTYQLAPQYSYINIVIRSNFDLAIYSISASSLAYFPPSFASTTILPPRASDVFLTCVYLSLVGLHSVKSQKRPN
jgi:hypothetical protein